MKKVLTGIATAAVFVAATIIPATPASANETHSRCVEDTASTFRLCVVLEFTTGLRSVRGFGSVEDLTAGDDVVAAVVKLRRDDGSGGVIVETSPPALAIDYALTATHWHKCSSGVAYWWVALDWNYKGLHTGTLNSPVIARTC
jgi:hypothetical protein